PSGAHLYLHPFPTRRSSDLLIGTWDPPCCAAPVRAAPLCHSRDSQQGSDEECQAEVFQSLHRILLNGIFHRHITRHLFHPLLIRDRKSTRLNSSHDQISYAV